MGSGVTDLVYAGATNVISSLGFTTAENFSNMERYASGIGTADDIELSNHPFLAARVDWQRLHAEADQHNLKGYTKLEKMLILSIANVIEQSGVDVSGNDCTLIFSTTKGNIDLLQQNIETPNEQAYLWKMAQRVADYFKAIHRPIVVSNACISGVSAIILASRLVRDGRYRHVLVVGGDILSNFVVSGFTAFKSVSSNPCVSYDVCRDGLTLGEGCGTILITSESRLSSGVVVEGGAVTNDANHISGPSRTGDGLSFAILEAMQENNLQPNDISFINAHGTATLFNDEMEAKAIALAGLIATPVNSLKPYLGHTLGASGVIESIMCVEHLKRGVLMATKGFAQLGVSEPIRVNGEHKSMGLVRCIKTASGFGGCNGAVVFALEQHNRVVAAKQPSDSFIHRGSCRIANGKVVVQGDVVYESDDDFPEFIRNAFKRLGAANMKFYKMDNLCKLGYLASEYLLANSHYGSNEIGVVLANRSSSLDTDIHHQQILNGQSEPPSPAVFVYTLPNVVLGEICIRQKIQGENTFFVSEDYPRDFLEYYARMVLDREGYKAVVFGWCELLGNSYEAELVLIEKEILDIR